MHVGRFHAVLEVPCQWRWFRVVSERYCPNCNASDFDQSVDVVELVCNSCGSVLEKSELQSERNETAETETEANTGNDEVDWEELCSIKNSTQSNVAIGLKYVDEYCEILSLTTDARKLGAKIFTDAMLNDCTDGRPLSLTAASSLYLACRSSGEPRPLETICRETGHDRNAVSSVSREIQVALDLAQPIVEPHEYVPWLSGEIGLSSKAEAEVYHLLENLPEEQAVDGTNPAGTAGAGVYLIGFENTTQREVARAAGVTKETIRVRLNTLREVADV